MRAPLRSAAGAARGKWIAAAAAIAVHVAFLLVLLFTVNWQNTKPDAVTAELYAPPAAPAKAEPAAKPAPAPPKPAPEPPKPAPEPPKPAPERPPPPVKPAPEPPRKVEPPPRPIGPSKAEIALKEKQELERRRKDELEQARKQQEKKELDKREADNKAKEQQQRLADARERQAREAEALKAQADRERVLQAKASANAAKSRASSDYVGRIQAKIRGNVVLPPDIGNPEAIFEVVQLPTGEIIDVQLRKSSGVRAYDEAVQRAILKSSPLPQPGSPEFFQRTLTLKFRPQD